MSLLIVLLIVGGLIIRSMTPDDRERHVQTAIAVAKHVRQELARPRPELETYYGALSARMPRVVATPALIAINVLVFFGLLFGAGSMGDSQTLLKWGANYGPVTTNLGWWRLFTGMFVNPGLFQLLVAMLCLWQIGGVVERLIGRAAMCGVYVAGGVSGALLSVSSRPLVTAYGASASIFALYGLLVSSTLWTLMPPNELSMPRLAAKRFVPGAVLFFLFSLFNDGLTFGADVAALIIGLIAGAVLAWGALEGPPQPQRLMTTFGAAMAAAIAFAVPMRGITDARPEIARLVATEDETVGAYKAAVEGSRRGKTSAEAMAQLIERTIMPELQAAESRLKALNHVPDEQHVLVANAEEYLRLRRESWRLRADGLRKTHALGKGDPKHPVNDASSRLRVEAQYRANVVTLGKAEGAERQSLEALEKIKPGL
jgi:membrane associated rhomboid family serine protease